MSSTSVIIVSYRPEEWLAEAVESVVGQADEVIVVDNGSSGSAASLIGHRSGARVVRSDRNLGFAPGVALGLRSATGEIVGLLNDDAVAGPGWLSSASSLLSDPGVAAVTPKVVLRGLFREVVLDDEEWFSPGDARPLGRQLRSVTSDGADVIRALVGAGVHQIETGPAGEVWRWTKGAKPFYVPVAGPGSKVAIEGVPVAGGSLVRVLNHAGSFLRDHGLAGEYGLGAPDDGRFDEAREPFGFSGTAPVFRASTLRRIGGFAEPFFAYNEDTDWCLRARLCGLRVAYDPSGIVTHRLSATSGGTTAPMVRRLSQRNALLCLIRNAPVPVARDEVGEWLRRLPSEPVARSLLRRLPWAVGSRLRMSRQWVVRPEEIWDRWAEADSVWDTSPARASL